MATNQMDSKGRWRKRLAIGGGATIGIVLAVWGGLQLELETVRGTLNQAWTSAPLCQYAQSRQQRNDVLRILGETPLPIREVVAIAETILAESKRHDIPAALLLAIMKKESNFNIEARSSANAMGVMQIHPLTWDAYAKKLNLEGCRKQAFNPVLNIRVSAALINDLRHRYERRGFQDQLLWDYILSAYYAGSESLKGGLKSNHRRYVKKVRQYADEMGNASRPI